MQMTIGRKLIISFLTLALLVCTAGVVGIVILNKVSQSADIVLKETSPVQYAVMNAALSVEKAQKVMKEYINATTGIDELENDLKNHLQDFDMWISMVQNGTDSEVFKSSASGERYKTKQLTINVLKATDNILAEVEKILEQSKSFKSNIDELTLIHREFVDYSVTIDSINYPLPALLIPLIVLIIRYRHY